MTEPAPCVRCEHGPDDHRLATLYGPVTATPERRDLRNLVADGFDVPREVVGPFRCRVDGCDCPDYVDEPLSARKGAK